MVKAIALASDHGGYALKNHIRKYLEQKDISIIDFGTDSPDSCDCAGDILKHPTCSAGCFCQH